MSDSPTTPGAGRPRPGRLGVGVVGAGRAGAVLGSALRAAGHAVVGVSAISEASRTRAEALLPQVPVLAVPDVVERAELVLLAVPDDALAELVQGLADVGAWQPGQLVVHVSGRYGTDVLRPARERGAIPLAIHPAMTFTGTSIDLSRLEGTPFAVTAPGPVLPIAQALVVEMGGEPVVLAEEQRGLYHAALAHGSNHLVVLVAQSVQLLRAAGIDEPGRLLSHLLGASLDGALRAAEGQGDPISALTGPVSRGDAGTVREHLEVLGAASTDLLAPDLVDSYRALARAAAVRTWQARRIDERRCEELLDLLSDGAEVDTDGAGPESADGTPADGGDGEQP